MSLYVQAGCFFNLGKCYQKNGLVHSDPRLGLLIIQRQVNYTRIQWLDRTTQKREWECIVLPGQGHFECIQQNQVLFLKINTQKHFFWLQEKAKLDLMNSLLNDEPRVTPTNQETELDALIADFKD